MYFFGKNLYSKKLYIKCYTNLNYFRFFDYYYFKNISTVGLKKNSYKNEYNINIKNFMQNVTFIKKYYTSQFVYFLHK